MNIPFKIAFNTSAQLAGKVATTISTLIVIVIVTRNFSVGDYGNYTAILSYIAIFYVFTDFGLNAIFVRETGEDKEKQREYFKNLLGLRFVTSILLAFLATAILAFTDHSNLVKLGIIVGLGIIAAQSFLATSLALFQTRVRYDQAMIADLLGAVANVIFVYIAATNFGSILFVIGALVLGSTVKAGTALYLAKFQIGVFGFSTVFSQFNAQIDKQIVLLANYKPSLELSGDAAAGFYGLAYKVFELAIVLPAFVMNVGYPIMVQKRQESVHALIRFSKKLAGFLFAFSLVGLILGWFLAPFVIGILGGEEFDQSVFTTRILLIGFPLFFITPLTLWLAIVLNKSKEMMFIYGFAAAFNLVANLVTVPNFGYNAAALVTIVSEILILALSFGVLAIHFKTNKI
jgi:O-antigen/teichoic acid export membrane protein